MQTLLLACYICLQLVNLPNDLTLSDILKRDTSCDQCLTGLFDSSELTSSLEKQTPGELLLSNPEMKEALEERLINKLPKRYLQPRFEPQKTVKEVIVKEEQVNKVNMLVEDMLKATETAIKIMQEKAVEMMKMNLNEMLLQLEERQMQLRRELELATNRQLEIINKNEEPIIEESQPQEVKGSELELATNRQLEIVDKNEEPVIEESQSQEMKVPQRNMLNSEEKLFVGESLVSENGRFQATMESSGLVIITDKMKGGLVVKKFGDQRSDNPESKLYLMVKQNGNLVIKDGKMLIWHCGGPNPKGGSSHFLKLDNDGQMVVYNAWNYRVWTSGFPEPDNKKGTKQEGTSFQQVTEVPEDQLKELETLMQTVQDIFDNEVKSIGNLQEHHIQKLIATKREKLRGDLGIIRNTMEAKSNHKDILGNDILFLAGSSLVSKNGEYKATMMRSGQLIITDSAQNIVARIGRSMSHETDASHYIYMQADGNLVIYNIKTIRPTWHSSTYTPDFKAGSQYYLQLENNGELVMYDGSKQRIWTSIDPNPERGWGRWF